MLEQMNARLKVLEEKLRNININNEKDNNNKGKKNSIALVNTMPGSAVNKNMQ